MIRVSLFLSGRLITKMAYDRPEIVIGRDPSCDLVVDNLGVSRRHARIVRGDSGWAVEDLGSSNGVFVCGSNVKRHALLADDEFSIGKYTIRFEETSGAAVPTVAAESSLPVSSLSAALSDERGDLTFALDRSDLAKIIEKARTPAPTGARAPRLTRVKPMNPPMIVPLSRNHYMAGTGKGCDIRLKGWLTPRRAALFVQEGGRDLVISLADSTRVKVNGKKVDSRTLADGDLIQIGRNRFVYTRG